MMVHKVDNSLLIDDFDIHKNLLRKQSVSKLWDKLLFKLYVIWNIYGL